MHLGVSAPGVYVGRLDANERKRILPALVTVVGSQRINVNGPVRATYAAGHLFYLDNSDRTVMAQAFDVRRLQLRGAAVRIAENVENPAPGLCAYDVSETGMLVYRPQPPEPDNPSQLSGFDRGNRVREHPAKVSADQKFLMRDSDPPAAPARPMIVLTDWSSRAQH